MVHSRQSGAVLNGMWRSHRRHPEGGEETADFSYLLTPHRVSTLFAIQSRISADSTMKGDVFLFGRMNG